MKLCIVCGKRKAEVPDRNRIGRGVKRVCRECHADPSFVSCRRCVRILEREGAA